MGLLFSPHASLACQAAYRSLILSSTRCYSISSSPEERGRESAIPSFHRFLAIILYFRHISRQLGYFRPRQRYIPSKTCFPKVPRLRWKEICSRHLPFSHSGLYTFHVLPSDWLVQSTKTGNWLAESVSRPKRAPPSASGSNSPTFPHTRSGRKGPIQNTRRRLYQAMT